MDTEKIKRFVNDCIHNPLTWKGKVVNGFLVLLITFSIAVIPVHLLTDLAWLQEELMWFERFVVTIFTIEYVLRIWSAKLPFRYITSWWGVIDLVAVLPFYLAELGIFEVAPEIFLLLRVLRILKFCRSHDIDEKNMKEHELERHGDFECIENEKVEKVVQKHPIVFLLGLLLPLFFTTCGLLTILLTRGGVIGISVSVLLFAFAVIFFIKAWLDYNYDVIYITNFRVIVQDRQLFGAIKNDIAYESITNVVPNNLGIICWILRMGNIHIETAAFQGTLVFENAPNPHFIVRHISNNRQRVLLAREGRDAKESSMIKHMQEEEKKIEGLVEELEHRKNS
ncbi:ion transporter [Candidatus Gracilibacteria bacterium]|nr:ion transporter [Candidatus Gracilibacteria bacterium]